MAGTGFALGMSRIADMRRGALGRLARGHRRHRARRVPLRDDARARPRSARWWPAARRSSASSSRAASTPARSRSCRSSARCWPPWTVGALLVNLLLPAMFALDRAGCVNLLAPALMALHVAATAVGGALCGADGVVGAAFVAPLTFAVVLLVVGAGRGSARAGARAGSRDGVRFVAARRRVLRRGRRARHAGLGGSSGASCGRGRQRALRRADAAPRTAAATDSSSARFGPASA